MPPNDETYSVIDRAYAKKQQGRGVSSVEPEQDFITGEAINNAIDLAYQRSQEKKDSGNINLPGRQMTINERERFTRIPGEQKDISEEALSPMQDIGYGLKPPEHRLDYLISIFGPNNVKQEINRDTGDIDTFVLDKKKNLWERVNNPGFSAGDVFRQSRNIGTAVGGATLGLVSGGATLPLRMLRTGLGAAAADAGLQGASKLLPGKEDVSLSNRAARALGSGAIEATGEGIMGAGIYGLKAASKPVGSLLRAGGRSAKKALGMSVPENAPGPVDDFVRSTIKARDVTGVTGHEDSALGINKPRKVYVDEEGRSLVSEMGGGKEGANVADVANKRLARGEKYGVDLNAAQASKSAGLKSWSMLAKESKGGQDLYLGRLAKQTEDFNTAFKDTMELSKKGTALPEDITRRGANLYKNGIKKLLDSVKAQGKQDFGIINDVAGKKNVVLVNNTVNKLREFINKPKAFLGADTTDKEIAALTKRFEELTTKRQRLRTPTEGVSTADEGINLLYPGQRQELVISIDPDTLKTSPASIQRSLEIYGDVIYGNSKIVDELSTQKNKRIAKALKSAMEEDLEAAAKSSDPDVADIAGFLQTARSRYSAGMDKVKKAKVKALTDLVKNIDETVDTPEAFIKKMASGNMSHTSITKSLGSIRSMDPGIADEMETAALSRVLGEEAMRPSTSSELGFIYAKISPAKMAEKFDKNESIIKSILYNNPQKYMELKELSVLAKDIIEQGRVVTGKSATDIDLSRTIKLAQKIFISMFPKQITRAITEPAAVRQLFKVGDTARGNIQIGLTELVKMANQMETSKGYTGRDVLETRLK